MIDLKLGDSLEVLEAKLKTLKYIKCFIEMNIVERKKEINQLKKKGGEN